MKLPSASPLASMKTWKLLPSFRTEIILSFQFSAKNIFHSYLLPSLQIITVETFLKWDNNYNCRLTKLNHESSNDLIDAVKDMWIFVPTEKNPAYSICDFYRGIDWCQGNFTSNFLEWSIFLTHLLIEIGYSNEQPGRQSEVARGFSCLISGDRAICVNGFLLTLV